MFDRLIASEPAGADVRNRRKYFMVSSVIVSVLFTVAVVISIYAADYGLGSSSFELVEMIAPSEMVPEDREEPQPRTLGTSQSQVATRQVIMARIDETPNAVPTTASVVPNTRLSRPYEEPVKLGTYDGPGDPGAGRSTGGTDIGAPGLVGKPPVIEETEEPEPPPVKIIPVKKPPTQTLGVINGKASYLPKPVYSAAAIAVHAQGRVDVQVSIDEDGRVTSANAVNGHPLLRAAAEQAARNAKFTPTYLSKVPVKVTGVIIYNFTR